MLVFAADLAAYLDDAAQVLALYERAAASARERGAVTDLPIALWGAALASARFGRIAIAEISATEGLELANATGQVNIAAGHRGILARVAAFRGARRSAGRMPLRRSSTRSRAGWAFSPARPRRPRRAGAGRRTRRGRARPP